MDIEKLSSTVLKYMSKFRFKHSLRVAKEAKNLAQIYHVNEEKAYVCGLLHDIAREFPEEMVETYVIKYSLNKSLLKPENIEIAHAEIGPYFIHECFPDLSSDILQAIKYHTIGNKDMNLFDKIIFIADKTARLQQNEVIKEMKLLSYQDLDASIFKYLLFLKEKLKHSGKKMHPESIRLLESLKK